MRLLLAMAFLLISCATVQRPTELTLILDDFKKECAAHNIKLWLDDLRNFQYISASELRALKSASQYTIGMCVIYGNGIYADVFILYPLNYGIPDVVIWHEFFHCMLNQNHYEKDRDLMNHILPLVLTNKEFEQLKRKAFERIKHARQ